MDEVGNATRISRRVRSYTQRQSASALCARQGLPHAAWEAPKRGTSRGPLGGERGAFQGPSERGTCRTGAFRLSDSQRVLPVQVLKRGLAEGMGQSSVSTRYIEINDLDQAAWTGLLELRGRINRLRRSATMPV